MTSKQNLELYKKEETNEIKKIDNDLNDIFNKEEKEEKDMKKIKEKKEKKEEKEEKKEEKEEKKEEKEEKKEEKEEKEEKKLIPLARTNTNFMYDLFHWMKNLKIESEWEFLTYYQFLTLQVFSKLSLGTRGLLICYKMGLGKTLPAVAISMALKDYEPIMMGNVSQQSNYIQTIIQYLRLKSKHDNSFKLGTLDDKDLLAWIKKRYKFVTLKASNMMTQLGNVIARDLADDLDTNLADNLFEDIVDSDNEVAKLYETKIKEIINLESLDGKLLIVDEAHNLFRAITNGSKNGIRLYELIMKSKNMKLVFLTGTPVVKDPFELVPCFNMLGGYYNENELDANKTEKLVLPEKYTDFYKYFVDSKTNTMINKNKFQNRILGLVSFVNHKSKIGINSNIDMQSINIKKIEFPEEKPLVIRYVNMDEDQYMGYILAREHEKQEASRKAKYQQIHQDPLVIPGKNLSSTYRIRSRQISNFWMKGLDLKTMTVNDIPSDKAVSPKFLAMLEDMKKSKGLGMVFSQLLHMCGLEVFAKFLNHNGWKEYNDENKSDLSNNAFDEKRSRTYAFISGDIDTDTRDKIKHIFNSPRNMHGELISLILISEAGAEGLDLKNIRYIMFLEPPWTMAKFEQVKHRGIRGDSHTMLDPSERNVSVYLYLAIKPASISEGKGKEILDDTTDIVIYQNSYKAEKLILEFESAVQEASVECYINGGENCRMCNPSNQQLFDWNITNDMKSADNCVAIKHIEKKVNVVKINGNKYYWEPSDSIFKYNIYYFDTTRNDYKKMNEDDVRFISIIDVIESENKKGKK